MLQHATSRKNQEKGCSAATFLRATFATVEARYDLTDYPLGLQRRPYPYRINTTADHWWPKGLQRLWADSCGYISRIKPTGEIDRRKPPKHGGTKGFAHKRGGHRLVYGISPWNHTFEPTFSDIDNLGPSLVVQIYDKLYEGGGSTVDFLTSRSEIDTLAKLCFSLMIRSPSFHSRYSKLNGIDLECNEEIGKANIAHFWKIAKEINLEECNFGTIVLLRPLESEFIFGDGLCETIFRGAIGWRPQGERWVADLIGDAFIPLLPSLCAYIYFSSESVGTTLLTRSINSNLVDQINELTQAYSKEQLFFRTIPPALSQAYEAREHMSLSLARLPLIAELRQLAAR